jgi:hypothetical protein
MNKNKRRNDVLNNKKNKKLKRTNRGDELSELLFYTTGLIYDIVQLITLYFGGTRGWTNLISICTFTYGDTFPDKGVTHPIPKVLNIRSEFLWFLYYESSSKIVIADNHMEIIDSISAPTIRTVNLDMKPRFSPFRKFIADGVYASWLMYDDRICLSFGLKSDTNEYYLRSHSVQSDMRNLYVAPQSYEIYSFEDKCIIEKDRGTFCTYSFDGSSIIFVCKFDLLYSLDKISITDSKIYRLKVYPDGCDIREYGINDGQFQYTHRIKYCNSVSAHHFGVTETMIGPHFMILLQTGSCSFFGSSNGSSKKYLIETLVDRMGDKNKSLYPQRISFSGHRIDDITIEYSDNNSIVLSNHNGFEMLSICMDQKKGVVPAIEFHDTES